MPPSFASYRIADSCVTDAVLGGKLHHRDPVGTIPSPNLSNAVVGQLRACLSFAAGSGFRLCAPAVAISFSLAILGIAICAVICVRSEKQVLRVATGRIVASVTDEQSIRDWPKGEFVGNAVGKKEIASARPSENSVAGWISCTDPRMASLNCGRTDLASKPLLNRNVWMVNAVQAAIPPFVRFSKYGREDKKLFPARLAYTTDFDGHDTIIPCARSENNATDEWFSAIRVIAESPGAHGYYGHFDFVLEAA